MFELLIVLVLFGTVVLLINQVFFSTLRTTKKSEDLNTVRQQGSYAVSVIQRHLQNATAISPGSCDPVSGTSISYFDQYGFPGTFSCLDVGGSDSRIASGSSRLTAPEVAVAICSISCPDLVNNKEVVLNFKFTPRGAATATRVEEKTEFDIITRVILRGL